MQSSLNHSYLFRMDKLVTNSDFKITSNPRCRLPTLKKNEGQSGEGGREGEIEEEERVYSGACSVSKQFP